MRIQAFFWDYDNTILASEEAHWNKHRSVLAKQGIELNQAFRKRIYENNGIQNWEWLTDELGLTLPQNEYLNAIDTEFQRNLIHLEMRSGIPELFELIKELSIPQAIITNARRESAEPVLTKKAILPQMEFVLFKEDYQGRKPDPSPYLAGIQKMHSITGNIIDPKKCIAVEDDPKGVESASKAGIIVIHRKLKEIDPDSPFAHYTCFHKEDFINIVKQLIL